tara:strand:+ start:561 stop:857 length:297 start_codon:yes stop_codon:yes gene_type:complete
MKNEKIIYSIGHPSYIKLSAVLDDHGLMSDKEDELIQDILNTLDVLETVERTPEMHAPSHKRFYDYGMAKPSITGNDHITHGADTLGDEWEELDANLY